MRKYYLRAMNELIELVEKSRDFLRSHNSVHNSLGSLLRLGDDNYNEYVRLVQTNEFRAAKSIESIAVGLLSETEHPYFELYPVPDSKQNLPYSEQARSRPFQIVLNENGRRVGVVFCGYSDVKDYHSHFIDKDYVVDELKIVILASPDELAYETLYNHVNEMNVHTGVAVEQIPVLNFWKRYFGEEECAELMDFINEFNAKAREIIGFNTVVSPTQNAIVRFKAQCGNMLTEYRYEKNIPETVYPSQIEVMKRNYLKRGLWRAMIGNSNFATSFITSEWYLQMYQLTENLDLTNIVAGYLKSVEQLLFAILQMSKGTGISIQAKNKTVVEYTEETESVIDSTLGSLEKVIQHNGKLLDVNKYAREYMTTTINEWRKNQRNGYFHKDNLHSVDRVNEIREKAIQLYFIILGSCTIHNEQLGMLGIEE